MEDSKEKNSSEVDWFLSSKKRNDLPLAPSPDAEIYKRNKKRGTAIIFNHKNFSIKDCSTRLGTDKDRDDVKQLLDEMKFDVISHDDLTLLEILRVLDIVSKMDHSDSDCLLVVAMSHGDNGILYAKDSSYKTKKLWNFFSPLHCPSLAGKPKIFFIQACRGDHTDPGVEVTYNETDYVNEAERVYSIPIMADFLIMYATVEGYFAWRDPNNGSYFIQALINQIKKLRKDKDLLSILTRVNREVALGFTSSEPNIPELNGMKEMCSIVSMLTRDFYLD